MHDTNFGRSLFRARLDRKQREMSALESDLANANELLEKQQNKLDTLQANQESDEQNLQAGRNRLKEAEVRQKAEESFVNNQQQKVKDREQTITTTSQMVENDKAKVQGLQKTVEEVNTHNTLVAARQANILEMSSWEMKKMRAHMRRNDDFAKKVTRYVAGDATVLMKRDVESAWFQIQTECSELEVQKSLKRMLDLGSGTNDEE